MPEREEDSAVLPDRPLITIQKSANGLQINVTGMREDLQNVEVNSVFIPVECIGDFMAALNNLVK